MLENGDFDFIFCFNEVNMLKGIRGFAPTGILEKCNKLKETFWVSD
jgi:hypothetical protein